jgi:hypothetical protein
MEIAVQMFSNAGLTLAPDAYEHMQRYLAFIHEYRDKYFGNARTVRQVVEDAVKKHNLRLANIAPEQRDPTEGNILTMNDLESFKLDKSEFVFNRKSIGFGTRAPK